MPEIGGYDSTLTYIHTCKPAALMRLLPFLPHPDYSQRRMTLFIAYVCNFVQPHFLVRNVMEKPQLQLSS